MAMEVYFNGEEGRKGHRLFITMPFLQTKSKMVCVAVVGWAPRRPFAFHTGAA